MAFIRYNENPFKNDTIDYAIRAISTFLDMDWDDVFIDLCVEGFINKDMPNKNYIWDQYLKRKGLEQYLVPNTCPECVTVESFADTHPIGKYLLGTGSHVIAIQAGQSDAEVAACGRAMSQMERSFATQTAITQAIQNLQSQQADCCCENRLATCQTQNVIQREGSDTRYANAGNTRDIIDTINNKVQTVMDKLCQLELDGVKAQVAQKDDIIAQLRSEAMYARGEASRLANADQIVDNIYNRLNNCPVGTTPVYGRTPIFTCNQNGCGCNGSF